MLHKQKKIWISVLVVLILGSSVFTFPKKTQAIFGVGDITAIDIDSAMTEILKGIGFSSLKGVNELYTRQFLNKVTAQYKINDYQKYASDLVNNVLIANQVYNLGLADAYKLQANVKQLQGKADPKALGIIYQKEAQDAFNIYDANSVKAGPEFYAFLGKSANVIHTTPQGRQILAETAAMDLYAQAKEAAAQDIANGSGYGGKYDCTTKNLKSSSSQQSVATLSNCLVGQPGDMIANSINSKISGLFNQQLNPPDHYSAFIGEAIGSLLIKKLDASLFPSEKSNNPPSVPIDDSTPSTPPNKTLFDDVCKISNC